MAMEAVEGHRGGEWLQQTAELNARDTLLELISAFFEERIL